MFHGLTLIKRILKFSEVDNSTSAKRQRSHSERYPRCAASVDGT